MVARDLLQPFAASTNATYTGGAPRAQISPETVEITLRADYMPEGGTPSGYDRGESPT